MISGGKQNKYFRMSIDMSIQILFTYRACPGVDSIWFYQRMAVSIQSTGNALWHNDLRNCRD